MKKIITATLLALFSFLAPMKATDAVSFKERPENEINQQLEEKRSLINERVKESKTIQKAINKKSKKASDLYMLVFSGSIPLQMKIEKR